MCRIDPADQVQQIWSEVEKFGGDQAQRERWLVLNKKDLLPADEFEHRRVQLVDKLGWQGPVYGVSAATGEGTEQLMSDLMVRLEKMRIEQAPAPLEDEPWDPLA